MNHELPFPQWGQNRFFVAPSMIPSSANNPRVNVHFFRPRSKALRFSVNCNFNVKSLAIPVLLLASCPSAVRWLVIPIAIYTVNAMFWRWRQSHICKKVLKRFKPSFADSNPLSPIIFITNSIGVHTAAFHSAPCIPSLCFSHIMFCAFFNRFLEGNTPA